MTHLIIGLIITMIFSAFFSGMEIAFVSSNRLRAEMDREKNGLSQRAIDVFYRHPNNFVSTMLVGNNIALVVYGILFAHIFDQTLFYSLSDGARVTADTLLSTVVVLFTGEFLPKTIFKSNPNTMLTIFAVPAYVCYVLLYPVSKFATHDEIDDELKIFHNALDFSDTKVRDCMIPRTEIEAIDIEEATVEDLKAKFVESGHSKIIAYQEDIDHIIGYIHSSEMFRLAANKKDDRPASQIPLSELKDLLQTMPYVPETMAARKLMHIFLQQKKSLGVVIDEFGGTSGIVSLEDIVEEIFGDIEDEHDSQKYIARQMDDGTYLLSARLEIEKVNEMFDLELPESDEYMTVGGLILHEYQSFPKLNEIVTIGHFEFKIIKNTMTKIELVKLKLIE